MNNDTLDEKIKNVSEGKKKNAEVYSLFFSEERHNKDFLEKVNCDIEYHGTKKESLAFSECIGRVFNICTPEFQKAFNAVISGEGHEKDNINTLHSSALIGLLCFYKVSENNPLKVNLPISDDGKCQEFNFTSVEFEKTNRVFSPSIGLSSIDIALRGESNNKKVVLYLESKFSEYLDIGKSTSSDSKGQYKPIYEILKDYLGDLTCTNEKGKLIVDGNHYCHGIKQMISHTIGAINSEEDKGTDIYLAPILYDFWNGKRDKDKFEDYCNVYKKVSSGLIEMVEHQDLNEIFKNSAYKNKYKPKLKEDNHRLFISNMVFSYQDFFSKYITNEFKLDQSVKDYYHLQL